LIFLPSKPVIKINNITAAADAAAANQRIQDLRTTIFAKCKFTKTTIFSFKKNRQQMLKANGGVHQILGKS